MRRRGRRGRAATAVATGAALLTVPVVVVATAAAVAEDRSVTVGASAVPVAAAPVSRPVTPPVAPTVAPSRPPAPRPAATPAVKPAGPAPAPGFTIAATGDLLVHSLVADAAARLGRRSQQRFDFTPLLAPVAPVVSAASLAICHQETPFAAPGQPVRFYPRFRSPPELAVAIRRTGWDACSTASNHSMDGGAAGVAATIRTLTANGVTANGTRTDPRATGATFLRVDGYQVAHLAATFALNTGTSTPPGEPWMVSTIDPDRILRDAHAARVAGAQFVVVSLHWGTEYDSHVTPAQRALARRLLASPDVDLIVGCHVHVVQPVERVNGKIVFYGMGNLLAKGVPTGRDKLPTRDALVAEVRVQPRGGHLVTTAVSYVPTYVDPATLQVLPVTRTLAGQVGGVAVTPDLHAQLVASYRRTVAAVDQLGAAAQGIQPDRPV